jgi:hypothetical protein
MIENTDGTFGEPFDLPFEKEALTKVLRDKIATHANTMAALHVGTRKHLEAVKKKKRLERRLDELEERLSAIEHDKPHPMAPRPGELLQLQRRNIR